MKIFTGTCCGVEKHKNMRERDMGMLISSTFKKKHSKACADFTCALDNGAYTCWQKRYPFMAEAFRMTMRRCFEDNISLEFIVTPDIVAHPSSLEFSLSWAKGELLGAPNLALAVQDGMSAGDVAPHLELFNTIFVGGTKDWKWRTAKSWVGLAARHGLKCHIGRTGGLSELEYARDIGADSVDSSSFARNDAWHIIDQFNGEVQPTLL